MTIDRCADNSAINHPSFLKVPIQYEVDTLHNDYDQIVNQCNVNNDNSLQFAIVKKALSRLGTVPVDVPFAEQLGNHMKALNIPDGASKFKLLVDLLKNITRIHNAPSLTVDEMLSDYFRIQTPPTTMDIIRATKKDYYVLWLLMDSLLNSGCKSLSQHEERIFNAIHWYAIDFMNTSMMLLPNDTERVKMNALHANERAWADKGRIEEKLRIDGGEKISPSALHRELQKLKAKQLILEQKASDSKNKNIYQINTFEVSAGLKLPHPSTIIDPICTGNEIEVVNPLTGERVTI